MGFVSVKKMLYKLLCNRVSGKLVVFLFRDKIPDVRWKGYAFNLKQTSMPPSFIASVFWGFYESAEIRFVEKYYKGDLNVVELGGSCGIVSAHLVSKMQPGKMLVSVEANKSLQKTWEENTRRHNLNKVHLELLNNAVDYHSESVPFYISSNTTESSALSSDKPGMKTVKVPSITLGKIVEEYISGNYILVSDIEGSEAGIFLNEQAALSNCNAILIELHDTIYLNQVYTVEVLKSKIEEKGFRLAARYGPVFYFERLYEMNHG